MTPQERHDVTYAIFQSRMHNLNLTTKKHQRQNEEHFIKTQEGEVLYSLKNVNVVKENERLWQCSRVEEAKGT